MAEKMFRRKENMPVTKSSRKIQKKQNGNVAVNILIPDHRRRYTWSPEKLQILWFGLRFFAIFKYRVLALLYSSFIELIQEW